MPQFVRTSRRMKLFTSYGGALLVLLSVVSCTAGVEPQPVAEAPATLSPTVAPPPTTATATPTATAQPAPTATITSTPTTIILASAPRPAPGANVPNVRVSAGRYTAHSEVTLAQNPRDPQNLVGASKMFTDNATYVFRIGTYASFDDGQTWIDNGQLPGLEEWRLTSDPTVVFNSNGTAYLEVLAAQRSESRSALFLYRSTDGGRTWLDPILISDDATGFNDKEWLAADTTGGSYDSYLYTAWVQLVNETYRILFARSTDGGATWSAPVELVANDQVTRQGPVVSVDAAGTVYVLWVNLTTQRFETARSIDGGATFNAVRTGPAFENVGDLNGNLRRSFALPAFTADPATPDRIYLVWDDGRSGNGDVLFSVSEDGGGRWSSPVMVNGDPANDQFQPWLAVNGAGDIFVQWFDRRDDPNNLLVHTYAARSTDGGRTWSELRVTDVASDPTVGLPRSGEVGFYGDYQALVADTAGTHLFWNETRDGSQEVYTAYLTPERWQPAYRVSESAPVQVK